ncbi:helix-turn-helix transcriptional regulator [Streptomyces sp. NPDC019937]|uniref:helix-turn-helix transcriptional regulator n=1 Tax=Streptomyces sp. NPDC019937 TaxID=3154787 RepID=UPI0033F510C4
MRTVYPGDSRHDPATLAHARWLTEHGGQARTVPSLPSQMVICDGRVAVIALDDGTSHGAAVLSAPGMIAALQALFENTWRSAQPLGTPFRSDPGCLSRRHAEALRLLAEGYTDGAIARKLGVSTRTARRIAQTLMARLDARSRFQAGTRAVQRGHLPASGG